MAIYYNNQRDLGNPMAQAGIAPPMYQRGPYATATVMAHPVMQAGDRGYYPPTGGAYPQYPYGAPYGPSVGFGVGTAPTWSVTPLTGYPSAYPHVLNGAVMAGEPFRMTQYFGPAYMPGFMDMMMARLLQGMMGGGRRAAAPSSKVEAPPLAVSHPRVEAPPMAVSHGNTPPATSAPSTPRTPSTPAPVPMVMGHHAPIPKYPPNPPLRRSPMLLITPPQGNEQGSVPQAPELSTTDIGSWQLPTEIELEAPFTPFRRWPVL